MNDEKGFRKKDRDLKLQQSLRAQIINEPKLNSEFNAAQQA